MIILTFLIVILIVKNTERSLFTKNKTNISLFISQKQEASSARAEAEAEAKRNNLETNWNMDNPHIPNRNPYRKKYFL